jgi:Ca2+/Na+ antiporter
VSETLNSNTVNLVFGVSVPALFVGLGSTGALARFDVGWLVLVTAVVIALLARRAGVGRSAGLAILALYAVFVAVQIGTASW